MAMSKDDHIKKMEAILTCSICLETFQSPKTLSCSHTFCETCLKDQVNIVIENGIESYECPKCRKFCGKDEIIDMKILTEDVDVYDVASSTDNICELCRENKAEMKCTVCTINNICIKCLPMHTKTRLPIPGFTGHNIITCDEDEDSIVYCEKHTREILDLYCSECKHLVCSKCSHTAHKQHETVTVEDALNDLIPVIQSQLVKIEHDSMKLQKEKDYFNRMGQSWDELHITTEESYTEKSQKELSELEEITRTKIADCEEKQALEIQKTKDQYFKKIKKLKAQWQEDEKKIKDNYKEKILDAKMKFIKDKQEKGSNVKQNVSMLQRNRITCTEKINTTMEIITNEYNRKADIVDRANLILEKTKGSSLMQVLEKHLKDEVKSESVKDYQVATVDVKIPLPLLMKHSVYYMPIKEQVNRFNSRLIQGTIKDIMTNAKNKTDQKFDEIVKPSRMFMVQNCVWIPQNDNFVQVYSLEGKNITNINLDNNFGPFIEWIVQQVPSTDVFLASSRGLYVLDINGQLQYKLEDIPFCDVTTNGKEVIAATPWSPDTESVKLYKFEYLEKQWQVCAQKEFKMHSNLVHKIKLEDLLSTNKSRAYDFVHHCNVTVVIKNECDNMDYVYAKKDSEGKLCGVDTHGNTIQINGRAIQILGEDNKLKLTHSFETNSDIMDILVIGSDIYVLHERMENYLGAKQSVLTKLHP